MHKLSWQVTLIWAVVILAILVGIVESAAPASQGCTTDLDCMMQEGSAHDEPYHPFHPSQEV